jgi:epoxyqueuosine reductase
MNELPKTIANRIQALGFSSYGVVDLETVGPEPGDWLQEFVANDFHGSMKWIAETAERRSHPNNLWADAKSAIVLSFNYGPDTDPMGTLDEKEKATISVYARNRDYHDLIKGKLKELAGLIARDSGEDVKVFVDTAPLMEKPLAAKAGVGWQGKHTNLVSREFGSWLFLGVILTSAKLSPTDFEVDHCGTCRACLDICPTNAFPSPYKLDARLCISYLTIEHTGPIDEALRPKLGNRIYGCDDCLAVCPWNKFAVTASEAKLQARDDLNAPDLAALAVLGEKEFREKFSGSPIKRIGRDRFIRNVLYAIGNSEDRSLLTSIAPHLADKNPVVKDAALWAKQRLEAV